MRSGLSLTLLIETKILTVTRFRSVNKLFVPIHASASVQQGEHRHH